MTKILRRPGTVLQAVIYLLPENIPLESFDAFPYFSQAEDTELYALAEANWKSYSHNDRMLDFTLANRLSPHLHTALAVLLLSNKSGIRRDWYIDVSADAILWMMANRPGLWQSILDETGDNDTKTEE